MDGLILGLDLCDGYTQLSCWGREENWTLPTAVCRQKDGGWLIGETAYATALAGEGSVTDKLIRLVLQDGSDTIYGVKYRAVDLLKCFLEQVFSLPLEEGKTVDGSMVKELVITVPKMKARLMDGLMYCADQLKIPRSHVHVISHTEAFMYFRKGSCNWDYIGKFADKLTPKITTIMNIEFQVMRKMSKSFCLIDLHPSHKVDHRINMYLENHELITDYLLTSVLRLVDRSTALKKSDCQDTAFWQSIKRTKMIDVRKKNKNIAPLHRDYSREHNIELMKNSFVNKAVTLSIYAHGLDYDKDIQETVADSLCLLNDNDVKRAERYRSKVKTRLNKKDWEGDFDAAYK